MTARLAHWWTDRSLRTKVAAVVAIPVLAMGLAATAFVVSQRAEATASTLVTHTIDVKATITQVLEDLIDVETGVRGYVITGQTEWLAPYDRGVAALPSDIARLQSLVANDPTQAARVTALRPLVAERLEHAAHLRGMAPVTAANQAAVMSAMTTGKVTMDDLRLRLAQMGAEEGRLLELRQSALAAQRSASNLVVAGTLIGAILGGGFAALLLSSGVVGRIQRLQRNAVQLAEGEALVDVPTGGDEIGSLAATLVQAHALLEARTQELRTALAEVEDLYDNAPVGYHSLDAEGRLTRINATELAWLGRSRDEVLGRPFADFLTDEGRRTIAETLPRFMASGSIRDVQFDLVAADGRTTPIRISATAIRDADGRFVRSRTVAEDVTERQQSERWAADLFDSFEAPVIVYDPVRDDQGQVVDFKRVYANPRLAELLGRPMKEVLGAMMSRTTLPQYVSVTLETFKRVLATGISEQMSDMQVPSPGGEMTFSSRVSRLGGRIASVNRDVTLERTAEHEIRVARESAEEANRAKTEFLSRMSHELRTPLNAIIGFAQLLELDRLSRDQRESVAQILSGGRHLLELINEVLDISRIESRELSISPEPVSMQDAIADVVELIAPLARERNVRLEIESANAVYIHADRQRLRQVMLNLLSNAVKYNRPNGAVTLTATQVERPVGEEHLRVAVTDEGAGIEAAMLDRVFVPFDRLGAERTGVEGTGLGLSLSKALIAAMGGQIGVESTPGQGTTFWFSLPVVSTPVVREVPDAAVAAAPDETAAPVGRERTILYIEDNPANFRLIERALQRRIGVRLIAAMLGGLGIDLAVEHRPDLILLDLHLPDLSGEEVLRRLRANPATGGIPIIVLSAEAAPRIRERLLGLGATEYMTKPIDLLELYRIVDVHTGGQGTAGATT